ncbi:MAG: endopeptidase La, partial [Pseudomonadales bacterium]
SQPTAQEEEVHLRALKEELASYAESSKKIPREVLASLNDIKRLPVLVDSVAMHLSVELASKQEVLETPDVVDRAERVLAMLDIEADVQQVEKKIRSRVKKQMEKSQREYYLNEQMKAIQKELGDVDGSGELEELETKIKSAKMPSVAEEKALTELGKLKMMSPMSAEASVLRNYIDWMVSVPWHKKTRLRHDLEQAEKILEKDHYGLEEVKERILEFLAVQKRVKKLKGPILCLVGPPGVGKTSLGESIARATNRKFVRMSLGGVRDEAEIRGHRRTYIGSMPGKIAQKLAKVEVKNPLFLLDEIDKMGMDFRGDPASALLEVLDPEQNNSFNDHYLEVDYDLSEVLFVCTANSMNIPGPLLDRMEVIRLPGYTEDEKIAIAERYLLPRQAKANGLRKDEIKVETDALRGIIQHYTKEAGVRGFDREIAKLCRKVVKRNSGSNKPEPVIVSLKNLEEFLGVEKFTYGVAEEVNRIGQVTGLAWTQVGGEILTIEASSVKGSGKVIKTGSLGDVMQESIQAAMTVVRGRANSLGIDEEFANNRDIHIHVPEGATPKDGPSAGVGMVTALVSELTGIPVRSDVAMTGEITLRGEVLAIGGVKEKLLAAHRAGIKTVVIPQENAKNLAEIPDKIKQDLEIKTAKWIDEVLEYALESIPAPKAKTGHGGKNQEKSEEDRPSTH